MSRKKAIKVALIVAAVACWLYISGVPAGAQCAMCKTALTNSPDAARLAQNFNFAVLVLLIPPVLLFCGIFVVAFRFRKAPGKSSTEEGEGKSLRRLLLDRLGARLRRRGRKRDERRRRAGLSFH